MKPWRYILITCFFVSVVSCLNGQRFSCDGQLLIGTSDGVSTSIIRPVYIPFSAPFLSAFSKYQDGNFDALGFNSKDNFIYGVEGSTNSIVRLYKGNMFERIGTVSLLDSLKSNAGDCTSEGLYICHDYQLNQLLVFEVVDDFQLLQRIDLFWDSSSTNNGEFQTRIFDFAVDPNNPSVAFAYQGIGDDQALNPEQTKGYMLKINIDFDDVNLGMVTPMERLNPGVVSHIGGLVFSSESSLSGFGTSAIGLNPPQNTLSSLDAISGQAFPLMSKNPAALYSDGCSCPYSFTFTNYWPAEGMYCNNDQKTIILKIENNSYNAIEEVILRDTLPNGMIISEISDSYIGDVSPSTIGSNIIEITQLIVPPKSEVEIRIKVQSIDVAVGPIFNQAYLHNLPEKFDGVMRSDDKSTTEENDATLFYVTARELEDVSWEIIQPTDCLEANNGKIVVSSPQFFPGQEFEIRLRNKVGWEEFIFRDVIDENNSFTADSLLPGDYQIFHVRSLSDNCSLAVKDTTVLLEAPNDLLSLELSANSPVCEGETLRLNSAISPIGTIRWTGPLLFGSESLNPMFDNALVDRSGEYKAVATYGYCSQTAFILADVYPEVEASIVGDSTYCVRDTLRLKVKGEGENIEFLWSGPNAFISTDSLVVVPGLEDNQEGYYIVQANNGACYDTTRIDVDILPTPTISLDDALRTDYCSPLVLSPEIFGDSDVVFSWSPDAGLSCNDCPYPEVIPIVQSKYSLRVENNFQCTDSATVNVMLDKEKLLFTPNVFNISSSVGNEEFKVLPGCVVRSIQSIEIYNRWGNKVYSAEKRDEGQPLEFWDGNVNGQRASSGVYIWFAKVELVDGSIQYLNGDITLLGA